MVGLEQEECEPAENEVIDTDNPNTKERRGKVRRDLRVQRRLLRESNNPFTIDDDEFISKYRLRKDMVGYLLEQLTPYFADRRRKSAIHPEVKIFAALRFLATGGFQRDLGQEASIGLSQSSVCRSVSEVSKAIEEHLADAWIKFPIAQSERTDVKNGFLRKTGFPGVIGAIGCFYVPIVTPENEEHNYMNHKGQHSKNIQIVCDHNYKIINVYAKHCGGTSNAFILNTSQVNYELRKLYTEGDGSTWLVGDHSYPQLPWMMTPLLANDPDSPEGFYNKRHAAALNYAERCIGMLKTRFKCLSGERILHYLPRDVGMLVNTCIALHNMCIEGNLPPVDEGSNIQWDNYPKFNQDEELIEQDLLNAGNQLRIEVVNKHFNVNNYSNTNNCNATNLE